MTSKTQKPGPAGSATTPNPAWESPTSPVAPYTTWRLVHRGSKFYNKGAK